ncbi:SGNH/GDSL hydrolase family protein [Phaeobacter sp. QD34_3]|uniref:SGNH/GDSL hydrolase family protein n=1 Tax=unclassified Phaeobacter TaxID=2621772 RepID=UPI00237F056F|nr:MULTISPECIES: SGNH/GDSL hydrolase family protein [unclassified Phaeobacter]MDE4132913.1 SGNH/GDSL hydrolase family protein [Phaeobacter sp. QD34_3]MDE4136685.1 SGNH/GDSL hydrolase family protein [Phaeobacter sp. QD34_24]
MTTLLRPFLIALFALFSLIGCGEAPARKPEARILVMGDSMLAWNGGTGQAVSDAIEDALKEPVVDRSVIGARMIYPLPLTGAAGLNIRKQFRAGDWDWIVVNGGGNDLWLGCGCIACARKLDRLAAEDAQSGAIPDLMRKLRETGARVIYTGYLRSPGRGSPIDHCKTDGQELDRRIALLAEDTEGLFFLSLDGLVPHGDLSFHAVDRIHPSIRGSAAIGDKIATLIKNEDG